VGYGQLIVRLALELFDDAALIYSSSVSKIGTFVGAYRILNAFFIVHIDSPEAGAHSQITGRIK
jgi:hypothetical protein